MNDWSAVPDALIRSTDTGPLMRWLDNRALRMSLLDLCNERRRRADLAKGSN